MRLALCFYLLTVWSQASFAQFTTIIDVPPDMAPSSIGSDTQLNVSEGGEIENAFDAGSSNGTSTNV